VREESVRIRYVREYKDGRVYFQRHRRGRKVRIRAARDTPEFFAEYHRLLQQSRPADPVSRHPLAGTWRWLCVEYFKSPAFKSLDLRTQRVRRGILEHTLNEPLRPDAAQTFAAMPIDQMTTKVLRVLRDRKQGLPEAGNSRVKAIRAVFKWAVAEEHASFNPARDLERVRTAGGGWHSWTVEEVQRFEERHPVGTKARLAFSLLMWTGVRRSDVVLLGRQHAHGGWLKFTQFKNRARKPVQVEIPILPALQRALEASPTGDLTYLVTDYGRPFTANGFGGKMRRWCDEAGLSECSAHGLRKASATIAAENGATSQQLMAIFGWLTLAEAERYTAAARRRKMAGDAMGLLVRNENGTSPKVS
jgi:integrase